jgi:hypothetical protein
MSTGLPLGQVLACCPPPLNTYVRSALMAQSMIRDGRIERSQAIEALKLSKQHAVSLEQALFELGIREAAILNTIEISELLISSGTLTHAKLLRAVEYSLSDSKPIAECLSQLGFVRQETLNAAKELRDKANDGEITRVLAIDALRRVHEDGLPLDKALAVETDRTASGIPRISATDLLRLASFVTKDDIEKVLPTGGSAKLEGAPDKVMLNDVIDDATFGKLLQCSDLIERNAVNLQQAIVVLHLCMRKNLTLTESLSTLGIHPTTH